MNDEIWPESLDALVVAPDHHTLLFENEFVRVLDTRIPPGDRTPLHTHRWPGVLHVRSWSAFLRRDEKGNVVVDSRTVPQLSPPAEILWSPTLAVHSLENVGENELRVFSVELKQSAR